MSIADDYLAAEASDDANEADWYSQMEDTCCQDCGEIVKKVTIGDEVSGECPGCGRCYP
jgi:hypothetical protein